MKILAVLLFLILMAQPAQGQWVAIGVRGSGSVPTGSFAEDGSSSNAALIEGAKNGFGYGLAPSSVHQGRSNVQQAEGKLRLLVVERIDQRPRARLRDCCWCGCLPSG